MAVYGKPIAELRCATCHLLPATRHRWTPPALLTPEHADRWWIGRWWVPPACHHSTICNDLAVKCNANFGWGFPPPKSLLPIRDLSPCYLHKNRGVSQGSSQTFPPAPGFLNPARGPRGELYAPHCQSVCGPMAVHISGVNCTTTTTTTTTTHQVNASVGSSALSRANATRLVT